jgi:hypothetical protein
VDGIRRGQALDTIMAKPALPWLKRLCALYENHEPSVYRCTAEPHVSGVLISIELDRGSVFLLAQPKRRSGAYASSASMDIAIHKPPGAGPMPGNGELVVRQFLTLLQRADKGDVTISGKDATDSSKGPVIPRIDAASAAAARKSLADEIHWASFLAYMCEKAGVSYPPNTDEHNPAEAPFCFLSEHLTTGFSRPDFVERFGVDASKIALEAFEKLLALGLISIDHQQVTAHINSREDGRIYRTFFFSAGQQDQAKAAWGSAYDPSTDYKHALLLLLDSER